MASISSITRSVDNDASIAFLKAAFGIEEGMVHRNEDGSVAHAELWFGDDAIMLGKQGGDMEPAMLYVAVEDPDAHHERANAAGAEIVDPLADKDHGSRDYAAKDVDGNTWYFGTYRPVRPAARKGS